MRRQCSAACVVSEQVDECHKCRKYRECHECRAMKINKAYKKCSKLLSLLGPKGGKQCRLVIVVRAPGRHIDVPCLRSVSNSRFCFIFSLLVKKIW